MPLILLTNKYSDKVLATVKMLIPDGFDFASLEVANQKNLLEKAGEADYFLASGRVRIDHAVLEAAKKLKMIQRTGVGTDTLDLYELKKRDIPVYVNAGVNAVSVAEHTILLMLAVLRRLPWVDAGLKTGIWQKNDIGIENNSLQNKAVGLLGAGDIGKLVAKMLKAFSVKILYYDPVKLSEKEERTLGIEFCSFDELMKQVDILSLHCPLNPQTRGIIGPFALSLMKKDAFIINTGRGPLIDETALVTALQAGQLKGAGLDVFSNEPPPKDHPLFSLSNVVLTPHVGGLTLETFSTMIKDAFENIRLFHNGKADLLENKRLI